MRHRLRLALIIALVVLLLGLPAMAGAQVITRGPYLQSPTPGSILVRWRTDIATDSVVGYAIAGGAPTSALDSAPTTEHIVSLSGLSSDTTYNYTIGTTTQVLAGGDLLTNGDGEHFFTTSPPTGAAKPTRVWIIGDSGTADANAAAVRDAYKSFTGARATDVWLMLGDNAYNRGYDSQYQDAVFDFYPQFLRQVAPWSAYGNHDARDIDHNGPPGAYVLLFSFPTAAEAGGMPSNSEHYYSFNYGNIHFIALDSMTEGARDPGSDMLNWLVGDLAVNTQDWTIAFWHHPPYSKGSHDSDDEQQLIDMRQNVVPLMEAGGVDLLLSGHSHSYERSYLIDGHHGDSTTLMPYMVRDGSDGNEFGDGAYVKPGAPGTPNDGAVHTVVGSSGKIAGGDLNHPVMYASLNLLGSMVLDIDKLRLDAAFVDSTGVVQDEFTIIKYPPKLIEIDIDPWSAADTVKPLSDIPIMVALLGASVAAGDAADFDASQADPASVRLGIGEAVYIATLGNLDTNADEEIDMVLAFNTQDTGIVCEDTQVSLVGETLSGEPFTGTGTFQVDDCDDDGCHP